MSKNKKVVNAPNVIITPEHQSAPKDPHPAVIQAFQGLRGYNDNKTLRNVHTGDTDEFGHREDPILEAHLEGMRNRAMDFKTPTQTVEAMLEQYEKSYHSAASQRWKGQDRWQGKENEEARMVRIMHPHHFIRLLNRAGIRASLDEPIEGAPRYERIWLNSWIATMKLKGADGVVRNVSSGRVGVNAWLYGEAKTVTTLQYPYGPEWSIMRFDDYNVPTQEKFRGWRTALLALIVCGVLTEDEAHRAFGKPTGIASHFYREQLQQHREITRGIRLQ